MALTLTGKRKEEKRKRRENMTKNVGAMETLIVKPSRCIETCSEDGENVASKKINVSELQLAPLFFLQVTVLN